MDPNLTVEREAYRCIAGEAIAHASGRWRLAFKHRSQLALLASICFFQDLDWRRLPKRQFRVEYLPYNFKQSKTRPEFGFCEW